MQILPGWAVFYLICIVSAENGSAFVALSYVVLFKYIPVYLQSYE